MFIFFQAGFSCKWVNDSQCLLLEWFDAIHNSPSQVYHLALPFCPPLSWLHTWYTAKLSQEVKVIKGLPAEWGMCSHTITLGDEPKKLLCAGKILLQLIHIPGRSLPSMESLAVRWQFFLSTLGMLYLLHSH